MKGGGGDGRDCLTSFTVIRYHAVAGWSSLVARWAHCRGRVIRSLLAGRSNASHGRAVQEETSVRSPVKFGEAGSGVIPSQAFGAVALWRKV